MVLGVLVNLDKNTDVASKIREVKEMGFSSCRIACRDMDCHNEETASKVKAALAENGVSVPPFWAS